MRELSNAEMQAVYGSGVRVNTARAGAGAGALAAGFAVAAFLTPVGWVAGGVIVTVALGSVLFGSSFTYKP